MTKLKVSGIITIVILSILCIGLCFYGHWKEQKEKARFEGAECVMTVVTSYSGSGIDGRDLGSGSFREAFPVFTGDVFYEGSFNGHWYKETPSSANSKPKFTIAEVSDTGVLLTTEDKSILMQYGEYKNFNTDFIVCDGINYSYAVCFTK